MKTVLMLMACWPLVCCAQSNAPIGAKIIVAKDVRTVNNIRYDITPVHAWYVTHKGERPMKNWKQFSVSEVKEQLSTYQHCVLKDENGGVSDVLIANLPNTVAPSLMMQNQLEAEIAALKARIEQNEAALHRQEVTEKVTATNNYSPLVNALLKRQERADINAIDVAEEKKQLKQLQHQHDAALKQAGDRIDILAMFTGKTYAGKQVWDCGRKQ